MGLLPANEHIETLDLSSFRKAVRHIHRAGIARNIQFELADGFASDLERSLERLNLALEELPAPEFEWNRLAEVLGMELLGRFWEYRGAASGDTAPMPELPRTMSQKDCTSLALLSAILRGRTTKSAFGSGSVANALNWTAARRWICSKTGRNPTQPGARRVQDLARALVASPAT